MLDHSDDIDALIAELHASVEQDAGDASTAGGSGDTARLDAWLRALVNAAGSDLLLVAGAPPSIRVDGRVRPLAEGPIDGAEIEEAVLSAMAPHARAAYRAGGITDASYRLSGAGRFRVNLHRERGRAAAAIRALPSRVPRLDTLGLPPQVALLAQLPRGLVLLGGATGSGKSTTLAALVDDVNRREARHIVTIEDPIEYEHQHQRAVVEQVEIGIDAPDFPTALRSALRQAPDIIVVGEMRDPDTMRIALAAAETGHLVFSTVHTTDAASTVARIADSFPVERQNTIRQELAMALSAVMTQMLLPKDGGGVAVAAELLMVSYGARQHVRKNALQHLHQEMTITRKQGSFTLEESLARLVKEGLVDRHDALNRAVHAEELEQLLA